MTSEACVRRHQPRSIARSSVEAQMRICVLLFAAVTAATVMQCQIAYADDDKRSAASEQPDPATVVKGKALYMHHCSHCHGFNMVNAGTIAFDLRQFPHNDK